MKKAKTELTFEKLKPALISLGFAFYGESEVVADPEATLLNILRISEKEAKIFAMLLTWLHKTHELIHVERLRVLASDMSGEALLALGVLALKQVKNGDRRFLILVDLAKQNLGSEINRESSFAKRSDAFLIEKFGLDQELLEFGIKAQEIRPAEAKKILTLEKILAQNPWLKIRALIGANFRADIAYVMARKISLNPYQAAKLVRCSQETAYRLWRGLLLYPEIELLASSR